MFMLQLFHAADELNPIDARLLREGSLRIGRDNAADWPINDPDCELSREHCQISVVERALIMRPCGTNGVFDDETGSRYDDGAEATLALPTTLRVGRFRLRASSAPHDDTVIDANRTLVMTPPFGSSVEVPDAWPDAGLPAAPASNGSLLEAFCEGAGLDPAQLASDDPYALMARAGAVYRQMVLGIGDLMAERDRARGRYHLSRTTIGGADNNPFKWAPTQRLAIDLLSGGAETFLSGPAALRASFRDIKNHLIASFAGLRASLHAAVDTFDPKAIAAASQSRGGILRSRGAAQIEEVAERHAGLAEELEGEKGGTLESAFIAAYAAAEAKGAAQVRSASQDRG